MVLGVEKAVAEVIRIFFLGVHFHPDTTNKKAFVIFGEFLSFSKVLASFFLNFLKRVELNVFVALQIINAQQFADSELDFCL